MRQPPSFSDATIAPILAALAADPADAASLAALADKMLEVSPADRVELLAHLADAASRVANCRDHLSSLNHAGNCVRIAASHTLPSYRDELDDPRRLDYALRSLKGQIADATAKALEDGHWYAVRVTQRASESLYNYGRKETAIVRVVEIVPLDGGTVTKPKQ